MGDFVLERITDAKKTRRQIIKKLIHSGHMEKKSNTLYILNIFKFHLIYIHYNNYIMIIYDYIRIRVMIIL